MIYSSLYTDYHKVDFCKLVKLRTLLQKYTCSTKCTYRFLQQISQSDKKARKILHKILYTRHKVKKQCHKKLVCLTETTSTICRIMIENICGVWPSLLDFSLQLQWTLSELHIIFKLIDLSFFQNIPKIAVSSKSYATEAAFDIRVSQSS